MRSRAAFIRASNAAVRSDLVIVAASAFCGDGDGDGVSGTDMCGIDRLRRMLPGGSGAGGGRARADAGDDERAAVSPALRSI